MTKLWALARVFDGLKNFKESAFGIKPINTTSHRFSLGSPTFIQELLSFEDQLKPLVVEILQISWHSDF